MTTFLGMVTWAALAVGALVIGMFLFCLLYTSDAADEL